MRKNSKTFLLILATFATICLFWLVAHIFDRYPWHGLFSLYDPDSLLFARLLEQSILKGYIVKTDNYGCFPYEIVHGLAPMYFQFLYYFVAFFYTLLPNCGFAPVMVAGTLPIIFTWLLYIILVVSVWYCCKNKSLTIMFSVCLLPGAGAHMLNGLLKLDYDWIISFCIWVWLISYCLYSIYKNEAFALLGGISTALLIGTWAGNPLFFFLCTLYGIYLFAIKREDCYSYFEYAYSSILIGVLLNSLYIFKFGLPAESFVISKYSWFQIVCCLASGVFFYILFRLKAKCDRRIPWFLIFFISFSVILLLTHQIIQSFGLIMRKDPIHATITELTPFYDLNLLNIDGHLAMNVVSTLGWAGTFIPIFIFLKPMGFKNKTGETLKDWSIFIIFMAMYQVRYLRWSGIALGLFAGFVMYSIWKNLLNGLNRKKISKFGLSAAVFILLLLHISQSFSFIRYLPVAKANLLEVCSWLKRNTPETFGYSDNVKPKYGILSYWDYGNTINFYAKRPTIVNNAMWGYRTMAEIFSSKNEKEAYDLCNEYKVKYILLNPSRQYGNIQGYWSYFKNKEKKPEYTLTTENIKFAKDYDEYFLNWLANNLGLTSRHAFKPADHYRLVYVGNTEKNAHAFPYVIFEVVKGAELTINADPETEVTVSLELTLDNINFLYKKKQTTDKTGKTTFILPYSTNYKSGRVNTDIFYKFSYTYNNKKIKAKSKIRNDMVSDGQSLFLENINK